jgi:N-acetyl sugar amidotransferase
MDIECDPDIRFDLEGKCNHCKRYEDLISSRVTHDPAIFQKLISTIKKKGKNKKYDCIIGLSGGVDSSFVAYLAKKNNLRPLAIHLDNGWNSELSVKNIEQIVKKLDIPLKTIVLNWEEFRDLQLAFLKAGVPDGEIPTDHAINASIWQIASKMKIPFILSGMNFQTESINVPHWSYGHMDSKYIKSVNYKNNGPKLKTFPLMSLVKLAFYNFKGIKSISILNYLEYNKNDVTDTLKKEIGWRPYKGKHFESSYTKFYQGYVLNKQFKIDKRKGHLSDLIYSKQLSRDDAVNELKLSALDVSDANIMKKYVARKFKITEKNLDEIILMPRKSRDAYSSNLWVIKKIKSILLYLRKHGLYPK